MKCEFCGIDQGGRHAFGCPKGVTSNTERIKEQLDRLLSVVNAVTCPHRHGNKIRPRDLTRLCNRQIEVEEALREMGYGS